MAADSVQEKVDELFTYMMKVGEKFPAVGAKFMEMTGAIMEDGAVKAKDKELIALGIAVGLRCLPCIYAHTKAALSHGAREEEILEAALVAVQMGGGPGMAHVAEVMKALEAFKQES